jgi:hypothetical protein
MSNLDAQEREALKDAREEMRAVLPEEVVELSDLDDAVLAVWQAALAAREEPSTTGGGSVSKQEAPFEESQRLCCERDAANRHERVRDFITSSNPDGPRRWLLEHTDTAINVFTPRDQPHGRSEVVEVVEILPIDAGTGQIGDPYTTSDGSDDPNRASHEGRLQTQATAAAHGEPNTDPIRRAERVDEVYGKRSQMEIYHLHPPSDKTEGFACWSGDVILDPGAPDLLCVPFAQFSEALNVLRDCAAGSQAADDFVFRMDVNHVRVAAREDTERPDAKEIADRVAEEMVGWFHRREGIVAFICDEAEVRYISRNAARKTLTIVRDTERPENPYRLGAEATYEELRTDADSVTIQREDLRWKLDRIRAAAEGDPDCPTALRDFLLRESTPGVLHVTPEMVERVRRTGSHLRDTERPDEEDERADVELRNFAEAVHRLNVDWEGAAHECGDENCNGDCKYVRGVQKTLDRVLGTGRVRDPESARAAAREDTEGPDGRDPYLQSNYDRLAWARLCG